MTSIQVAIKVRPLIQRENDENKQSLWTVVDEKTIRTHNKEHVLTFGECLKHFHLDLQHKMQKNIDPVGRRRSQPCFSFFSFFFARFSDKIFDETRTTQELFDSVAKPIISSAIEGINGTIFAYGQTSSGKVNTKFHH